MNKKELLHERHDFENMRHLVEWGAQTYGEKTAYSFRIKPQDKEIQKISFNNLADDVRAIASYLRSEGVSGKKVAVIGKMSYEWALAYFSILSAGAVIVPLDRDWGAPELAQTVEKAEAEYLFVDEDIADKAKEICGQVNVSSVIYLSQSAGELNIGSLIALGKEIFAKNPELYYESPIDDTALSLLVFTSGTTGKGKGVMLSQRAVLSDLSSVIPYVDFSEKTVGVLPPHHTYGSSVMLVGHLMIGSEIYISAGLRHVQRELKEQKPGHLVLVPLYLETFYRKIQANIKEQGKERLVSFMIKLSNFLLKFKIDIRKKLFGAIRAAFGGEVKMIISGGAPINSEIIEFFEAIGIGTLNGYGITECAPIIAVNRTKRTVAGSVGPILDIDTVRIDEPNEDGEGEILVKGPNVMLGYYKDEQATADAMSEDGYFRTGDYGKLVGDVIFITGRKKNLIILSNGKNVYPEEIESELVAVPGILDIIVYEGQSKRGMEHNAIVAEVFPDKEYIEKNNITDIKAHIQKYINEYNKTAVPYKKIAVLKVRDEDFPKNTLRKILRFKLDMSID